MGKTSFMTGQGPHNGNCVSANLFVAPYLTFLARGDIHDPDLNRISITVGEVTTSPDLKIATAYVCPLGGQGGQDVIALLAKNKSELRRAISKNLSLKFTPDLRFRLDETFDRMDETRRLFSQDDVLRDLDET